MHLVCPGTVSIEPKPRSEVTYLLKGGTGLHSAESSVSAMTFRYWSSTSGLLKSRWKDRVCFIHLSLFISSTLIVEQEETHSSRSGKSSRAWAPRDSFRAAAETTVWTAFCIMFLSSRVSTKSLPISRHHDKSGMDLRVPDHTPVLDSDLVVRLVNIVHLLDTLIQR
jgi:hypothetical protein